MVNLFSSGSSHRYIPIDDDLNQDDDLLISQDLQVSEEIPANYIAGQDSDKDPLCKCCVQKPFLPRIPRINFAYFNNDKCKKIFDIFLCLCALVTIVSISIYLGYYTLFKKSPSLVIDKSYRAFQIPDHEASLHWGALDAAKRNLSKTQYNFEKMGSADFSWVYGEFPPCLLRVCFINFRLWNLSSEGNGV